MNRIIVSLILAFLFNSVGQAEQTANPKVAWQTGQIVAEMDSNYDDSLYGYRVYRVFLEKTTQGYLVQEFYKDSNNKATAPFTLLKEEDITRIPYAYYAEPQTNLSITGPYVVCYENGQKMREGHYFNGVKDGFWTRWFANGQKNAEGVYKQGKLEGLWRMWNIDGSNMNETFFRKGRLEAILSDIKDDKSNELDDRNADKTERNIWLVWDKNGNLKSQVMLVNGKKEGTWVSWDDKGKREMIGFYKNDKREGIWKTFWLDEAETKCSEGIYKRGKKDGVWTFWDIYGNKVKEEYYKNGKLVKKETM